MQWRQKTPSTPTSARSAETPGERRRPRRTRTDKADRKPRKPAKLSRLQKPEGMSLEDWQIELRRQFGREQDFTLKNLGDEAIFSEFEVHNPQSQSTYRVRVR